MTHALYDDDGFGFLGEIRRFEIDNVEWQVFEFRRPVRPYARCLTIACGAATKTLRVYPRNWRTLSPEDLVAMSR